MRSRARTLLTVWLAVAFSIVLAATAVAQAIPPLPAYGEPTIISAPGLQRVFTADFTRDGIPDIAAVTGLSVTVYPGLGNGQFGTARVTSGFAGTPWWVGDFNGDGTPDLAMSEGEGLYSTGISVAFGNGDGRFQPSQRVGALPYETVPAVGDFDGDGRSDVIGAGCWGLLEGGCGIIVLWGTATGGFATSVFEVDLGPSRVLHVFSSADFTGDGKPDLVWKQYQQNRFVVVPGLGARTFGFATALANTSAGEPSAFAAADFNADGTQDLVVLYSGGIGILQGNGDGTFQPVTSLGALNPSGSSNLLAWDINGDGRPDLSVSATEGVALFINNGNGTFRRYALTAGVVEPHSSSTPGDYGAVDFNSDGLSDFALAFTDGKLGVYLGLASVSASLAASSTTSTVSQAVTLTASVAPSDLTGSVTFYDGAQVLGNAMLVSGQAVFTTRTLAPGAHTIRAAYGGTLMNAPASFSSPVSHTVHALPATGLRTSMDVNPAFVPHGLAAGDLNTDGRVDLVAADWASDSSYGVFLGNGDGTLQPAPGFPKSYPYPRYVPRRVQVGDVNRDGKLDVFLRNESSTAIALGNGDGTFTSGPGDQNFPLYADVNRDGTVDRVAGAYGILMVWLGVGDRKGTALYVSTFSLTVAGHNSEIALGDFNGDSIADVAMVTSAENRTYVLLGVGDGTFGTPRVLTVGNAPTSPVIADFNGDGRDDLAFVNSGTGNVSVLLGKGDGDFLTGIDTTIGGALTQLAASDVTGDGRIDVAVISTSEDRVLVLPGNGNGLFGTPRRHYAGTLPMDLVVADFNGDGRVDLAVSSNADTQRGGPGRIHLLLGVNPAPTSVVLVAVPTATTLSQPVTLTATVSPSAASGWVTFNDDATPLGSVAVTGGQATFQTRLLGSGAHLIAAVFSGDGTVYGASASAPAVVTVAAADVPVFAPAVALSPSAASQAAQADFNNDGIVDIVVCASPQATVLLGLGNGQFTAGTPFSVCGGHSNLLTADFNRDGNADLATGTTVSFGTGNGGFQAAQQVAGIQGMVLAADFNGDGAPDLFDSYARVFLNRGDGTFASAAQLSVDGAAHTSYASAGDLNGDGRADLVLPASNANVYVLLARADGSFDSAVPYATIANPRTVAIGDFSGDGVPDFAVGGGSPPYSVGIMLGLGNGTFENWGDAPSGLNGVLTLHTCDCDGDRKMDLLAWGGADQPNAKLLRGLGDGTFQAPVTYASITDANWLLLTDLNQDGRPDIVRNSWQAGRISVNMAVSLSTLALEATPSPATLSGEVTLTAKVTPSDATGTVTFYDGAFILGKATLAAGQAVLATKWLGAGGHTLRAFYGGDPLRYAASASSGVGLTVAAGAAGGFGVGATPATGRGPKGLAAGDLNGDGAQDLVVANSTNNTISVLLGNGAGGFAPRVSYNTGSAPASLIVADLDGDATPDVAVGNAGSSNVSLFYGNGDGTLQAAVNHALDGAPNSLVAADLNLDQAMDLIVGTDAGVYAAFIGADGSWPTAGWSALSSGGGPYPGIGAIDLNGDGRTDVALATQSGWVVRLLQQAGGTFTSSGSSAGGAAPAGLAVAEVSGDGQLDLATANKTPNTASVLLGNGDGSFAAAVTFATGAGPTGLATTDVDGDGNLDLIVANGGSNDLTILRGAGGGWFSSGSPLATGGSPAGVVAADFDGNGIADLAVTNSADNTVSVFLGATGPALNPVPTLAGLAPSTAMEWGADFTLTVNGTNFVAGAVVRWNGSDRPTTYVSAGQLTAAIPAADLVTPGTATVTVFNPAPGGGMSNGAAFTISVPSTPPTVTAVVPNSGPLAGGTTVTIGGTGFVGGATSVTIDSRAATGIVVGSATSLTAVTPAPFSAGAKAVVVTTAAGSGTLLSGFTYLSIPSVSAVMPNAGPLSGGTTVTITGSGFAIGGTTVTIGGVAATGVVVGSASSLTAVTPAGTAGPKDVVVTTAGGSGTLASGFTYRAAPSVSGITSDTGPAAGGTTVTITGSGFVAGATTVTIGGAAATGVVVGSASSLTAVTPAGTAGPRDVMVTTAGGSATLAGGFTYLAAPAVSEVTPNSGPLAGGATVTITGSGFIVGATTVTVGGVPATGVVVASASSLTAVIPAGTAGPRNVVVTTAGGSGTLASGFTYMVAPAVSGITPGSGPLGGGITVAISGGVFVAGGTTVTIGGVAATGVVVGSASSLTAVTPAGTAGPKDVVVTTAGGSGTLTSGFTYRAAPSVSGITPDNGPLSGGTTVTITGGEFVAGGTTVTIGGAAATGVVVGSVSSLTAVTPAGTAGLQDVVVTTAGGSGTLTSGFTYLAVPTVSEITPNSGPLGGGATVTITGSGFVSGATTVTIGGAAATGVVVVSASSLTAVVPAGTAGARNVVVTTAGGSGTLERGFEYLLAPTVRSVAPESGPLTGGTTVTVSGYGFVADATSVTIGGVAATAVVVTAVNGLTAVTPAGTAGAKDVVVTTPGGSGTLAGGFTYLAPPAVSGVAPDSGPLAGNTTVTITGSGFAAFTTTVTIGGVAAAGVVLGSAGSLTAVTPVGTAGAKDVVVTTPGGSATLAGGFTYLAAPTVSGVTPDSGPWGGGTTVTITGSGFVVGATAVRFGSIPATGVVVSTGSSLSAVTPAGAAAGPTNVHVTSAGGSGTLAGGFTYINTCTSFSIEPTSATSSTHLAGSATVTVTGASAGCIGGSWTASGNGSWLTVSPTSGNGPGSATVSWSANTSTSGRSGSVTIAGQDFWATQAGRVLPVFSDDPLTSRATPIKVQHIAEIRQAVGTLRARYGLAAAAWTDATLAAGSPIKAIHITELRTALAAAYVAASQTPPTYTDPVIEPGVTAVKAAHIAEIRAAVLSLW